MSDSEHKRRRVSLQTQGCKVNQYETQVLREEFVALGWQIVPFGQDAELTVINSCTVTEGSDRDLRKLVSRARRGGGGEILVTGCRAEVDPLGSAALAGVDFVVSNRGKGSITEHASTAIGLAGLQDAERFPDRISDAAIRRFDGRGRAILKVQDGCNLRCTFCIVPSARGDSRSRSAADVVARTRSLADEGFNEVVLSGIQLGFYRDPDDRATRLADLLRRLLADDRRLRYRLGSLLPRHVGADLVDIFASEPARLCPHLHVSLQSGDDAVLRDMKRPYRGAHFAELMLELDERLDSPCLGTDVIVGFPTETEAAFERSCEYLEALPLAYGHVFPFSPRAGTRAGAMEDAVPRDEKSRRVSVMRELFARKAAAYRERQVGRSLRVIAERLRPGGMRQGTSENYQRLLFPAGAGEMGGIVSLRVTGLAGDALIGEPHTAEARA